MGISLFFSTNNERRMKMLLQKVCEMSDFHFSFASIWAHVESH